MKWRWEVGLFVLGVLVLILLLIPSRVSATFNCNYNGICDGLPEATSSPSCSDCTGCGDILHPFE